MRIQRILLVAVAIAALAACDEAGNGGSGGVQYQEVSLNTDYLGQTINAGLVRDYTFVAGASTVHTIAVTNLGSNIDWLLYDNQADADELNFFTVHEENSLGTADEIAVLSLIPGSRYWLVVGELDDVSSSFDLRIDN